MSEYKANSDEQQKEAKVKVTYAVKDLQNLFFEACTTLQTFESSGKTLPGNWNRRLLQTFESNGKTLPGNWNRRLTHREYTQCMIPAKKLAQNFYDVNLELLRNLDESIEFIGDVDHELSKKLTEHFLLLQPFFDGNYKFDGLNIFL